MKAIICNTYGPPEVAQLVELEKPTPKENEVLIKIHAASVNRTDAGLRSASYFISRFFTGLLRPKYKVFGCEFAGTIEAVGAKVTKFNIGDSVFGFSEKTLGCHAEYLAFGQDDAIAHMPHNLNFVESAVLTEGAHYALNDINAAKVEKGQNVLVNGATGAIGSAAVQLLKHFGANVTAVCGTAHLELVKSLGADVVIDYQKDDFTKIDQKFHFIFDAVGKSSFGACKPLLTDKGIYISTELGRNAENVFLALWGAVKGGKKVMFPIPAISQQEVIFIKELAESGKFKPLIDRQYKLEEIVAAYKYVESGQKIGNVVLNIVD